MCRVEAFEEVVISSVEPAAGLLGVLLSVADRHVPSLTLGRLGVDPTSVMAPEVPSAAASNPAELSCPNVLRIGRVWNTFGRLSTGGDPHAP